MPAGNHAGKILILTGAVILVMGVIWYFFADKLRWIGHLPGDIRIKRNSFQIYFPLTSLLLFNLLMFIIIRICNWLSR